MKNQYQEKYPDCEEQTFYRLAPVGKKGFAKMEGWCRIVRNGRCLAEARTEKQAWKKAIKTLEK